MMKIFFLFCKWLIILCTLIGAIILSINIQVGLNMHLYDEIGMHRRQLEGRHLVNFCCEEISYLVISVLV